MVEVVFQEVIFGQVGEVRLLDMGDVGGVEDADVHFGALVERKTRRRGRSEDAMGRVSGGGKRMRSLRSSLDMGQL